MRFFQWLHHAYEEWGFDLRGREWITEHTCVWGVTWGGRPLPQRAYGGNWDGKNTYRLETLFL